MHLFIYSKTSPYLFNNNDKFQFVFFNVTFIYTFINFTLSIDTSAYVSLQLFTKIQNFHNIDLINHDITSLDVSNKIYFITTCK